MYFFMKDDVETELEYRYSKYLLERYLNYEDTVNSLGEGYIETLKIFLRTCVFVHEDKFVFHTRKFLCHFNHYTNSCHEGTNNAVKNREMLLCPSCQ